MLTTQLLWNRNIKMSPNENKVNNLEPQDILKNLLNQKTTGTFCDVKLCLQGSILWGHACILASFSSYIMDYFRLNSDTSHWCPQKPLVIDLDIAFTASQDKCTLCLSTLVDFMYSQDLVIPDGHLQHFSKMIHYLKVVDLFPLVNTCLSKECNDQEFPAKSSTNGDLLYTAQNDRTEILVKSMPKGNHSTKSNISEVVNINDEYTDKTKLLNTPQEQNQSCYNKESNLFCSENVDVIVEEHNYGIKEVTALKPKCEFLCCTDEVVTSNTTANSKRKITCDICSFTAVSVKKFLKHIDSVSHLGTSCPICAQKFQTTHSLKEHIKDHHNSKPYLCQFCSKRSRFWEFYKMHLKVHCRNKQFYCETCQKSFLNQQTLKVHLKSHNINYLCSSCKYLTSDASAFKAHLLIHEEKTHSVENEDVENSFDNFKAIYDSDLIKHKTAASFLCNFCSEGFTQKSNLKRHVELKHSSVPNIHCVKCTYVTKRKDLLKSHMKRHHNCIPEDLKGISDKTTKRASTKRKLDRDQSEVVGVLIPVQLVSTEDSSTLNAFAVKTCINNRESNTIEDNRKKKLKSDIDNNDGFLTRNVNSISVTENNHTSNHLVESKFSLTENSHMNVNGSLKTLNPMTCMVDCRSEKDSLLLNSKACLKTDFTGNVQNMNITNSNAVNVCCEKNTDLTEPVLNVSQELNDLQIPLKEGSTNLNNIQVVKSDLLTKSGEYWLNEATGEFLNGNSLVNVQVIDTSSRYQSVSSSADNPHEEIIDPLHTLILSDTSKTVSILDLRDDIDEFKSNPQTPQTNLIEDSDNLFPWSCIDSSFCSTWVLNEATGELNMVSFNVQSIQHSDESKLDENTGIFSPKDDDETALFLNEGTGDLSVIYFNTSKRECVDNSKQYHNDQGIQDIPDNVSEHSNDADDFLNAEFFKATASFMAHKENETFLNELTGEFDTNIAEFGNYNLDLLENQISDSETYLNEETGEILWNVLDKNVGSDFFTNSESFKYDLDDSLNCDDFETFGDGISDFSSSLCLETTQDWRSFDETCDILLNECTGELVKKS